jgi:hypothetical protein
MPSDRPSPPPPARKPENIWLNLLCNLVLPALILSKLGGENRLGPIGALVAGLAFPLGYGIYDLIARKKWNLFSIVGIVSVALTGGLGLARVSPLLFAIKEAAIPATFAIAVIATLETRRPLVREFIFNDSIIDVPKVEAALAAHGTRPAFDRLLLTSTWLLAGSFGVSAVLNFALARLIIDSPGGTPEFTAELGRMTWLSWPVIMVPSMIMMIYILWRLFGGIHKLTGLELEEIMHQKHAPRTRAPADAKDPDPGNAG